MLRCLRDGCPWACGTRRTGTCAERLTVYGLGSALLLALLITTAWGILSIRDSVYDSSAPGIEREA